MDKALLRLLSLDFEGAGSYRQPTGKLPLANMGRVLIAGAEGAGKSMIPEVATVILQGKGSPRMRTVGLAESTIVNAVTGYCGTLEFESGLGAATRHVEITQAFKHKRLNSRYIIEIDGQREEPDGKPAQRKMVKRLAPLSMGEWLGVVYLSQGAVHDLLAGTPTAKREYLTSVFGLDFYDDLNTVAKDELKELNKKCLGIEDLEQLRKDLAEELREQDSILEEVPGGIEAVIEGIDKLSKRLQAQATKLGKLDASRSAATSYLSATSEIEEAVAKVEGVDSHKEATKSKKTISNKVSSIQQQIAEDKAVLKNIYRHQKARDRAEKAVSKTTDAVKRLKAEKKTLAVKVKSLPTREVISALGKLIEQGLRCFDSTSVLDPDNAVTSDKPWAELMAYAHDQTQARKKIVKVIDRSADDPVCPTCLQGVDLTALKMSAKALKKEADAAAISALPAFTYELLSVTDYWAGSEIEIGELEDKIEEASETRDELVAITETLVGAEGRATEAKEALDDTEQPEDPEALTEAVVEAEEREDELQQHLVVLDSILRLYEKAETLESAAADIDLEDVESEIESLQTKRAKTSAKYESALAAKTQYDRAIATIKGIKKQQDGVENKIAEHADNALKIKHYELELIPYFNSLRAAKVHACVDVLEAVLPIYVSTMSADQYIGSEVKLKISDDLKKVDLMLKAGRYSDWVSALQSSGGQRRGFTLAIIAALREVSPRRANIMFFDEPFADLESERKMLFVNRLLPTLMDRCEDLESIFLIAHDKEVLEASNDSFDSVWVAKRDAHGSRMLIDQKLATIEGR